MEVVDEKFEGIQADTDFDAVEVDDEEVETEVVEVGIGGVEAETLG